MATQKTPLPRFTTLLALLLAGGAPLFAANATFQDNGEPLHPSAVTTTFEGEPAPVVGAVGTKAQIEAGGKIMEAPADAAYSFVRMQGFAGGLVTFSNQETHQLNDAVRTAEGIVITDLANNVPSLEYRASLVSDTAYPSAFLVVVVFDREFLAGTAAPNTAVFFQDLGALAANERRDVALNMGKFSDAARERMQYFPMVFVSGREVRTNLSDLPAAYFRRLELSRHSTIITNYVKKNEGADKGLQPYVRIAPIFSAADAGGAPVPPKVNVRLTVDEKGLVQQADAQGEVPAGIKTELERAMRGWLFLPRLAKGQAVATKALVPVQINLPGAAP